MLGWERPVPDCRAVRERRLSVKQDYTITNTRYIKSTGGTPSVVLILHERSGPRHVSDLLG